MRGGGGAICLFLSETRLVLASVGAGRWPSPDPALPTPAPATRPQQTCPKCTATKAHLHPGPARPAREPCAPWCATAQRPQRAAWAPRCCPPPSSAGDLRQRTLGWGCWGAVLKPAGWAVGVLPLCCTHTEYDPKQRSIASRAGHPHRLQKHARCTTPIQAPRPQQSSFFPISS